MIDLTYLDQTQVAVLAVPRLTVIERKEIRKKRYLKLKQNTSKTRHSPFTTDDEYTKLRDDHTKYEEIKMLFSGCKNDYDCKQVMMEHKNDYSRELLLRLFDNYHDHHVSMLLNEQIDGCPCTTKWMD